MSAAVHELDFASMVVGWVNSLIESNHGALPFSKARIEGLSIGSRKRRDFTLLDQKGQPCLTGEIKLPWASDGHSPFVEDVILDARNKATRAGALWFFTWNVNELVLWPQGEPNAFSQGRRFDRIAIANIRSPAELENPKIEAAIRLNVEKFVHDFAHIFKGVREIERRPPDIYFIHSLESFLERPIQLTKLDLDKRVEQPGQKQRLDGWMRDRLGWTLGGEDILLRAAKYANYSVANKLIFYEALRKRFGSLRELSVPAHVDSGEQLFDRLAAYFDEAQHLTGDYETVFGLDPNDIGDRVPFYDNDVVESWTELAKHVHRFDFSKLDYDVIGQIFESLIAPEERHKFGQYYTRPEVVDLINSFCIRDGKARVMDPGCGGGTFLVRAYARKRRLSPRLSHPELLSGIYGVDISRFATHLSTINLAARDLVDAANYPRIARSDFMDLDPSRPVLRLPDNHGHQVDIEARELDAVIGNPPYVRQEDIPSDKKEAYQKLVRTRAGYEASGRSDLHCYFWGQALRFLKKDGWLGFLTSSQWLDVDYGFSLQKWLLENFKIIAIIESREEPWFVGARVATAVTIGQRECNPEVRAANIVRFIEIRRPIAEILNGDGTSAGMIAAADAFRDTILNADTQVNTETFRIRSIKQVELWNQGVALSELIEGKSGYLGSKWGIPLRAPDLWVELTNLRENAWSPLGGIADVRRGITTGADVFFYVTDRTREALAQFDSAVEFQDHFGVTRAEVVRGTIKVVRAGSGEVFPIEAKFLRPVIHSLMHIDRFTVDESHCAKLGLMVDLPKAKIAGTYFEKYVQWGERSGFPTRPTVKSRADAGHPWYDLTFGKRATILWAKSHQYRHCAPLNPEQFFANCNLYTVESPEDPHLVGGILNSSLVLLAKQLYGRPVGVEGNLKTEVIDVEMMPVPDWRGASAKVRQRIIKAMKAMTSRPLMGVLSEQRLRRKALFEAGRIDELQNYSDATELDQADRQELDDAVLELLGVTDSKKRVDLRARLYAHLQDYFEAVRRKEERGIDNKVRAKRNAKVTPQSIAADVFAQIESQRPILLKGYRDLVNQAGAVAVEGVKVPSVGTPEIVDDMLNSGVKFMRGKKKGEFVKTRSKAQAELVMRIVALGEAGRHHFIPVDDAVINGTIRAIDAQIRRRESEVRALIADRTQDPELQAKAFRLTMAKF
jgi:type I restriction-modification system DNA methylase subunit